MQLSVDSRRPIRHCSCRSGSVASLPLPPAAECLYRWADQRDEVVIVPNLQTRERKQRASPATARSVVVFPGATVPVEIGRLPSLKLVADLAGRGVGLLLGTQRDADVEEPAREDLYDVCVKGALDRLVRAPKPPLPLLRGPCAVCEGWICLGGEHAATAATINPTIRRLGYVCETSWMRSFLDRLL